MISRIPMYSGQNDIFRKNYNTNMENNTITHVEIPAPDLAKAIQFYSRVFNWKIDIITPDAYAYFLIGDTNTGGGLDAALQPVNETSGHQICVDVENIADALDKIEKEGGTITKDKTDIGGHGYYACFKDPNGNHLQIHSGE